MDEIGFNFRGGWHTQSFHLKVVGRNTFSIEIMKQPREYGK